MDWGSLDARERVLAQKKQIKDRLGLGNPMVDGKLSFLFFFSFFYNSFCKNILKLFFFSFIFFNFYTFNFFYLIKIIIRSFGWYDQWWWHRTRSKKRKSRPNFEKKVSFFSFLFSLFFFFFNINELKNKITFRNFKGGSKKKQKKWHNKLMMKLQMQKD